MPGKPGIVYEMLYLLNCVSLSKTYVPDTVLFGYVMFIMTLATNKLSVTFTPISMRSSGANTLLLTGVPFVMFGSASTVKFTNILALYPLVSFAKKLMLYLPGELGMTYDMD